VSGTCRIPTLCPPPRWWRLLDLLRRLRLSFWRRRLLILLLLLRWLHWWQRLPILLLSGFLRCLWGDGDFIVWNDVGHLPPYLFILGGSERIDGSTKLADVSRRDGNNLLITLEKCFNIRNEVGSVPLLTWCHRETQHDGVSCPWIVTLPTPWDVRHRRSKCKHAVRHSSKIFSVGLLDRWVVASPGTRVVVGNCPVSGGVGPQLLW